MTQAQLGLPLVIQQLYGGVPFTPGADTMAGGFRTSPGFRPGAPMNINMPPVAPTSSGFTNVMPQVPGVPFGAQTTLSDLVAFDPSASQYALAGFTVGEILGMPEFADFAQFQAQKQAQQTGGTATSAGLAGLETQLQQLGSQRGPEDRAEGFGPKTSFEPTTMKFVDGNLVYDKINPAINQEILGIATGQQVPGIPSLFSALSAFGRSTFDKVTEPFTKYREKKAEEERQARIAEEREAALALQREIRERLLADEARKARKELERLEKEKKDRQDRFDRAQRIGTGFKTEKDRDTATGNFSGGKKNGGGKKSGKGTSDPGGQAAREA